MPAAPLLRFTCANAFLRLSRSTIASINGPKAAWLSTWMSAVRVSVPSMPTLRASPVAPACQVISSSVFCRIARPRSPFYLPFHRSGLHRVAPPTTPSADFCTAVRRPYGHLSLVAETQHRSPEVRSTAFAARPSDLPPRPLMVMDFAISSSLVRPGRPLYPLLVYRAATLLHASFRPRLATTPLRFANPSPPSGWIKDFHLQAVDHARHTANGSRVCAPPSLAVHSRDFCFAMFLISPSQHGATCRRGVKKISLRSRALPSRCRSSSPSVRRNQSPWNAMFNTIILLAGTAEQVALPPVLRGHNPLLTVISAGTCADLAALNADVLERARLIDFMTPEIVSNSILARLGYGAFNFHPGPPSYPGWAPAHFALYERATEFGANGSCHGRTGRC